MSYTKHTWVDGELVTAAKMNNIENGIEEASSGGGVLVVHDELGTLDKTWKEIADAVASTGAVIVLENEGAVISADVIMNVLFDDSAGVYAVRGGDNIYATESASDYPSKHGG